MTISKKDVFYAKLYGIKSTIDKADVEQKKSNISIQIGDSFNELVTEIGEFYPDIKDALPKRISTSGVYHRVRKSDINYLDLEILVETVLQLLNLIEK